MLALWLALALAAAQAPHDMPQDDRPATLVDGLGSTHHAIATKSEEAQKFFDQGLTFIYAFNHDEAVRSFRRAAELDPNSPMPLWGIALALGPNINRTSIRARKPFEAVQQALKLAANAPPAERAYVERSRNATRTTKADLALAVQYKNAMAALVKQLAKISMRPRSMPRA